MVCERLPEAPSLIISVPDLESISPDSVALTVCPQTVHILAFPSWSITHGWLFNLVSAGSVSVTFAFQRIIPSLSSKLVLE